VARRSRAAAVGHWKYKMKKTSGKEKTAPSASAQDRFLMQMIEERKRVAVFLMSGVKLEGEIESYDQFVIMIKGVTTDQVYKHAISTIQPASDVRARSDLKARDGTSRQPIISRRKPRLFKGTED
jgi:host factor-I protein